VKFLADEDVDKPIVERLRKDGHFVLHTTILQDIVFLTNFFNRKARKVGAEKAMARW